MRRALSPSSTFDESFFQQHGHRPWGPTEADQRAAQSLHIELISRVATQHLDYSQGVEEAALSSIFELFEKTRSFCSSNLGCGTFEIVAWHVLNSKVRPFTTRWHSISQAGGLRALDTSDGFRADLASLQLGLLDLDKASQLIAGYDGYSAPQDANRRHAAIDAEMQLAPAWCPMGIRDDANSLATKERNLVLARRHQYQIDPDRNWAAGVALSGGASEAQRLRSA